MDGTCLRDFLPPMLSICMNLVFKCDLIWGKELINLRGWYRELPRTSFSLTWEKTSQWTHPVQLVLRLMNMVPFDWTLKDQARGRTMLWNVTGQFSGRGPLNDQKSLPVLAAALGSQSGWVCTPSPGANASYPDTRFQNNIFLSHHLRLWERLQCPCLHYRAGKKIHDHLYPIL